MLVVLVRASYLWIWYDLQIYNTFMAQVWHGLCSYYIAMHSYQAISRSNFAEQQPWSAANCCCSTSPHIERWQVLPMMTECRGACSPISQALTCKLVTVYSGFSSAELTLLQQCVPASKQSKSSCYSVDDSSTTSPGKVCAIATESIWSGLPIRITAWAAFPYISHICRSLTLGCNQRSTIVKHRELLAFQANQCSQQCCTAKPLKQIICSKSMQNSLE